MCVVGVASEKMRSMGGGNSREDGGGVGEVSSQGGKSSREEGSRKSNLYVVKA